MTGFSSQNIWYMRAFYVAWTGDLAKLQQPVGELDGQNLPQVVGQIPWGHNLQLLAKLKDPRQRLWYARKVVEHAWSRAVLVHQIELDLYGREGRAITNFPLTLPAPQSDLAQQTLKDPYVFDFLTLAEEARERDLERGLLEHLRDFMLELGVGFAFVGSQYHMEVDGKDYFIDLLFYHLTLRAFAVIDLKVEEFKPEFAGKMSFYLSAVDDLLRHAGRPIEHRNHPLQEPGQGDGGVCPARHAQADRSFGVPADRCLATGIEAQPAHDRGVGGGVEGHGARGARSHEVRVPAPTERAIRGGSAMKPGSGDKSYPILISGEELVELKELTYMMAEAFGLDGRVERYQGKRSIGFYRWDLDCLEDVLSIGVDELRGDVGESSPRYRALANLYQRIKALRSKAYADMETELVDG